MYTVTLSTLFVVILSILDYLSIKRFFLSNDDSYKIKDNSYFLEDLTGEENMGRGGIGEKALSNSLTCMVGAWVSDLNWTYMSYAFFCMLAISHHFLMLKKKV